ncbi:carotenogenesis protein carS [Myxococcus stipitatus DSM 14675]|uniref:Carotenogenesis protein carS n=1 Tax=Myxococcus stipitatus (strain DSM 14675 / JCM 12634 / Mx s8) TaxID=1278073 RepID=L7UC14_MYXSD|nr:carotenogenesis protein carS [Myxococcus stipitatus DSM 14675]
MIQDPSLIVKRDVDGAPVHIGDRVTVVPDSTDGTISPGFLGRTGTVVALVYDDPVQQYPADPLIQVRVDGLGDDLFFLDELVSDRVRARERVRPPRTKSHRLQ